MATFDLTGGAAAVVPFNREKHFTVKKRIAIPLTGVTNDVVKTIPIKAGWLIRGIAAKIITAGVGTTVTLDFGITGGTADGFDAAVDGKGAAGTVTKTIPADTYAVAGGYYATADGTVDILLKTITAMTTAPVLDVTLIVIDLN